MVSEPSSFALNLLAFAIYCWLRAAPMVPAMRGYLRTFGTIAVAVALITCLDPKRMWWLCDGLWTTSLLVLWWQRKRFHVSHDSSAVTPLPGQEPALSAAQQARLQQALKDADTRRSARMIAEQPGYGPEQGVDLADSAMWWLGAAAAAAAALGLLRLVARTYRFLRAVLVLVV